MTDTPLTDAHVRQLADGLAHPHWVAFARGLERDNQVLREEVKHQAICNGAGGSRELALRTTIAELQRENETLRRHNANLVNVLEALAKGKDVPGVTVAEIAEYAQSAVNAVRKEKPCQS
jgi:hypothetical protein